METKKTTKKQRKADMAELIAKLKSTPQEKLSKAAKYLLAHEHDEPVEMDMRAVLR